MGIPIGREYTSKLEGQAVVPVECRFCQFSSVAVVQAKGEGQSSSYLWLRNQGAQGDATTAARSNFDENARALSKLGTCPACGKRDDDAVSALRTTAWLKGLGLSGGGAALYLMFSRHPVSMVVVATVACIFGAVIALQDSWKWSEVDTRVRVLSAEELATLAAAEEPASQN